MKTIYVIVALLFLSTQFLCQIYAAELCEPQDFYNLTDSSNCKIKYNKTADKSDSREIMFEILKNYPYEQKDKFIKLLQRKIVLVDKYITQQQNLGATEEVQVNISKLEQVKQSLSRQLEMVKAALQDNWVSIRDQARKALEESAKKLQEIK